MWRLFFPKKLFAWLCIGMLSVQLGGCGWVTTKPATVADRTVADEQAVLGIELAYKAARISVGAAVDGGLISTPEQKAKWRELNRRAYSAVQKVEAVYSIANAQSALQAIQELLALAGERNEP